VPISPPNVASPTFVLGIALLFLGCSSGEKIHDLSGAVTFQDKPVPAGHIVFEPDTAAGNNGPAGFAKIKDGRYDTRILEGRGVVGGPHLVTIMGQTGIPSGELLNGKPIFPEYTTTADLPKNNGTHDFEVPKK
jgi:hypothetical protein